MQRMILTADDAADRSEYTRYIVFDADMAVTATVKAVAERNSRFNEFMMAILTAVGDGKFSITLPVERINDDEGKEALTALLALGYDIVGSPVVDTKVAWGRLRWGR